MKKNISRLIFEIVIVILSNCLYALGVSLFVIPSGIVTGGTTGLALFINYLTDIPVDLFVLVFNVLTFVAGFFVLGRRFALTTVISTFTYPVALRVFTVLLDGYAPEIDLMLSAIFAGLCIGVSVGMVMRVGSSTGGLDIPVLIINKYTKIPISAMIYGFDFTFLLLQALFRGLEPVLYGILLVCVYSLVIDRVIVSGQSRTQLQIVSHKSLQIRDAIYAEVDRGVTFLHGRTGYLDDEVDIILTVITSRELACVERLVKRIDPDAFLMVSRVSEVRGHGFSKDKKYL